MASVEHGLDDGSDPLPTISLHADEFNELIGDEFVPLLNKAGGAGFQVSWEQLDGQNPFGRTIIGAEFLALGILPEPATATLTALGIGGLLMRRRRAA